MTRARAALLAVLIAFFLLTSWFGRPVSGLWNSPDETANAFWAARVARGEHLAVHDVMVGFGAGAMHPRSMMVIGDALVPGSFPGLFLLYGALQAMLNMPLYMMTPLLTALAGILFGLVVARLFDRRAGYWSALLFFLHPAVLYYSARGLFHNVLFVDLLIVSAALFVLQPMRAWRGGGRVDDALGGFVFGWAMLTRTSEIVWALPVFAAFLPLAGKNRWRRFGTAALGAAIPLFLLLQTNASLYGSPFKTAYVVPAVPGTTETADAPTVPGPTTVSPGAEADTVLPFGFHPKLALRNAWHYGVRLFWWQSLLAIAGLLAWVASMRNATTAQKIYAAATILSAVWLAVLYGSWLIRDRLDAQVTIGVSYVRYFLPAYVAMIPFAGMLLARSVEKTKTFHVALVIILLSGFMGARVVAFAGDESLWSVRRTLEGNVEKSRVLREWFSPDSVVMTERFDKLLVPERLRIIPANDTAAFAAASVAVGYGSVYWYGLTPSEGELTRLRALAAESNLELREIGRPFPGETAYQVDLRPEYDEPLRP